MHKQRQHHYQRSKILSHGPSSPGTEARHVQTCAQQCGYVTLFSQDSYLPGVKALQRSIRRAGLRYPLIVMCTASVSKGARDELKAEGCQLRMAHAFRPEGVNHDQYVRAIYAECWNKLRMWEWTEFDRLVYLDADMVVTRNIDHLFDLPQSPLFAVGDCYGGRETLEERDACCHFSPDCVPEYFNAGFYVMTPSHQEFRGMENALASGSVQVGRFAEQDFLNGYFAGRWTPLPYIYNAQKRIKYHHNDIWDLSDVAVIHYVDEKPWSHRYSEENLGYQDICDLWWHIYEDYAPPSTATHRSPGPSPSPCPGLRGSNTSRSCSLEVGEKVARDEALEVHEL